MKALISIQDWKGVPERLRKTLDALPQLIWLTRADTQAAYFNNAWQRYTGVESGQIEAAGWFHWIHLDERARVWEQWQDALTKGSPFQQDCRLRHQSGSYRWFHILAQPQNDGSGKIIHWYGSCSDIHDRVQRERALAEKLQIQENMLDASVDCIKIINTDGTVRHMNKSGCDALGVRPMEGRFGMKWLPLLPLEARQRGQKALAKTRKGRPSRFAGRSVITGHASQYWDNILTPMRAQDGEITGILCVSRDVSRQLEAEKRLREESEMDALTGLYNRRSFRRRLKNTIGQSLQKKLTFGLALVDLDYFKHVNDTLGHAAGDHLLCEISKRLTNAFRETGFICRLGGDEFAIVLEGICDPEAIRQKAGSLLRHVSAPIAYQGQQIRWGVSAGLAIFPRDATDVQTLMRCADTALNDLKAHGRGGVRMYDASMTEAARNVAAQYSLAGDLIQNGIVMPHYQPKVRLSDGVIVGFEALLRFSCQDSELQSFSAIGEAFKDYHLATGIGLLMHTKIFSDMASWLKKGLPVVPVAINVTPVEFLYDNFAEVFLQRLEEFCIDPALVEIEVTEQIFMERGSDFVLRALHLLKRAGVRIALDDFGTGYSSFTRLSDYPVDSLKIDHTFVDRMMKERSIAKIVEMISQMGPNIALDIVAEGVETQEQRDLLREFGCNIGQGFLFSKAVSGDEVDRLLQSPPQWQNSPRTLSVSPPEVGTEYMQGGNTHLTH